MSMKSMTDSRRVYSRNGIIHTLIAGLWFGVKPDATEITTKHTVKLELSEDQKSATVTARRPGKANIVETWPAISPVKAKKTRAAKRSRKAA